MKIEDLMTKEVVTVAPDLPLKAVAAKLSDHAISGAPVCDADGAVVGVVSEADILRKEQGLTPHVGKRARWFARLYDDEVDKLEARTAAEAMTAPALTIRPTASTAAAARLMIEHRINRLPVVAGGKLVGIVTRADLVRAFHRTDEEIAEEVRDEVLFGALWLEPETLDLQVRDGVVTLTGTVDTESDARVAEQLIRRVPGVMDADVDLVARRPERPERRSIIEFFPR